MIRKLLVANRGEIAVRVMRSAHEAGIACVAVCSDPDASAPHVAAADESVRLPGSAPADTYLRADLLVEAALATRSGRRSPGLRLLVRERRVRQGLRRRPGSHSSGHRQT